jgi:hypothetical protein
MDSTRPPTSSQPNPAPFLIESKPKTYTWLDCCRFAQTLVGFSLSLNDTVYIVLPCK